MRGAVTDDAVYDAAIASLSGKLDVYDTILSKQKYLAGDVSSPNIAASFREYA